MSIDDDIISLWKQGFNGTEIGTELGLTRSAVMGRLHRMRNKGLIGYKIPPPKVLKEKQDRLKLVAVGGKNMKYELPSYPPKPAIGRKSTKPQFVDAPPAKKPAITIMDLNFRHCRYITQMETSKGPIYCGEPIDRKSYCKTHADMCYYKVTKRDDRAAKRTFTFGDTQRKGPSSFFD